MACICEAEVTPDLLARTGIALFGTEEWQAGLSKALLVNIRTIQRWVAGSQDMPPSLKEDLVEIVGGKRAALNNVLQELLA